MKTIGDRIRWVIEKHLSMPQADFARKLHNRKGTRGVSRQLVNRWLNDPEHPPQEKNIKEIAALAGVSEAWLRYGKGDPLGRDQGQVADPVMLQTALMDIMTIAARALGMDHAVEQRMSTQRVHAEDWMDTSPDLAVVLDEEETVVRAGQQWKASLQWSRDDIEGMRWQDLAHPNDLSNSRLAFSISRGQDAVVEFDGRAKDKKGGYHNIHWRVTSEPDRFVVTGRPSTGDPKPGLQVIAKED